jgi:general secretion pathway protein I
VKKRLHGKRYKIQGSRGFTLLEVMIAMAILAITLVAVFQSQSQSISMENQAKFLTTASLLAQGKMAEMEAADARGVVSGSGDFGANYPDYAWQIDVKDSEISSLKKIELVVMNNKMLVNNAYSIVFYKFTAI